ncbi:MAG TPA: hypothetical protein VLM89_00780 [Phycisphaerae bacterium]|nr:hypothetical protein [Phycisphaerae bacterium]
MHGKRRIEMPPAARPADPIRGRRGRPLWLIAVTAALAFLPTGCDAPPGSVQPGQQISPDQVAQMPLEKNVTGVAAFYAPYSPWIWNKDRSRIIGIAVNALYLMGPDSLGAFGDGVIRPRMYLLEAGDDARQKSPKLVKEWPFGTQQAMPWRAKKRTAMGWGYGFRLLWGEELDVSGKEIRMIVSFERTDGKVFHSGQKDFRVPPR